MRNAFCFLALMLAAAPATAQDEAAGPPQGPRRAPALVSAPPVELPGDSDRTPVAASHSAVLVARGGWPHSIPRYAVIGALAGAAVGLGWGLAHEDDDSFYLEPVLPMVIGLGVGLQAGYVLHFIRAR